jgi:anti-sigma28 factor (negative regulator of flagellin synthesis)
MYINRAEIEAASSAFRASRKRKIAESSATEPMTVETSDTYVSSGAGASMADLAANVTAEPMYREALVNELARRVSEGKYFVPAEQIVEKLLGRLVLEAMPA